MYLEILIVFYKRPKEKTLFYFSQMTFSWSDIKVFQSSQNCMSKVT